MQQGADFGESISVIDGDILVGEQYRYESTEGFGRAYLFDGQSGQLNMTFRNPEPRDDDYFAGTIAGGDGRVFIPVIGGGEPRVYAFSAQSGALLQTIHDPASFSGSFGASLAYGNGTLAVGDPTYGVATLGNGQAYLFSAATGELERTISNPEPNFGDAFGFGQGLAIFGDKLAVGAIGDNALDGRVWVFDRDSGEVAFALENPHPEGPPPPPTPWDWFGQSVVANEEIIAVGAEREATSGIVGSGAVYVFDSHTGALKHTLFSPNVQKEGEFGQSLALTPNGDILVGAWGTGVDGLEFAGHAYLFDGTTGSLLLDLTSPIPVLGGNFGWTVAAMDRALVVGAPSEGAVYVFEAIPEPSTLILTAALLIAAVVFRHSLRFPRFATCVIFVLVLSAESAHAEPGDLLFKLTAPDGDRRTGFGELLAIVDGDIVVGELSRFDPLSGPGRAYLFDGKTGQFRLTFSNPEREDQDHFAVALAGGNRTVFISTSGLPSRVYGFSSSTGELLQTFQEPTGMTLGSFGTSLAYGNDTLFVGDPSYSVDLSTVGTGRAYLFDTTTGELARTILNPEPNRGDLFGSVRSLALFGDKLAVGAIGDNALKGRVWVFDRSSGEVAFALDNPHPEGAPGPPFSGDWFGQTVAANDEIIAVGAELEDAGGVDNAGIVYVFDSNTGALRHTLISPQLEVDGDFGRSLTLTPDGDILVGAWATNVNGIESAGHAYLFDDITGDLLLDLTSPEPVIGGAFGWSVAAIEGALIVGAPSDGAVYVFEAIPEPSTLVLAGSLLLSILGIRRFMKVKQ